MSRASLYSLVLLLILTAIASGCQVHIRAPETVSTSATFSILSVVPSKAFSTGGAVVTINGSNFTPQTVVSIAGLSCATLTFVSTTELHCQIPPHGIGIVPVMVNNPNQQTASVNFTYYDATPGTPNFAVNLGGGISVGHAGGRGVTAISSIGEPILAKPQTATGISVHSGVISVISAP